MDTQPDYTDEQFITMMRHQADGLFVGPAREVTRLLSIMDRLAELVNLRGERIQHLKEQVEREIRVRNNVIAKLEAERDQAKQEMDDMDSRQVEMAGLDRDHMTALEAQVDQLTTERDELKESLRTTRLEQADKAWQVDELEAKIRMLEAELGNP